MVKKEFNQKDDETGLITTETGAGLFASQFNMLFSYRFARCEAYRDDGIFVIETREHLIEFLESCFRDLNPEFLDLLTERTKFDAIKKALQRAFRTDHDSENDFAIVFQDILKCAAKNAKREGSDGEFLIKVWTEKSLLGLGIVARPSERGAEHVLDTASGFIGKCDGIYKHDNNNFAVFEAKFIKPQHGKPWHVQGKNLALQLYNSFVGGEAQIGFALVQGGIHVMWKEENQDGIISMAGVQGREKTYKFHTLHRDFIKVNRQNEWIFFTKVFIHVARICSRFVENEVFDEEPRTPQNVRHTAREQKDPIIQEDTFLMKI
jgi:hypothetical protein